MYLIKSKLNGLSIHIWLFKSLLTFKKKLLTYWWNYYHSLKFIWTIEPNSKQSEVLCGFFYSIIPQKIKISMLVFIAIKFTYLLLNKTFPVFLFLFLPCNCLLHHVEDYAMNFWTAHFSWTNQVCGIMI
jgi:hypothetical protein